MLFNDVRRYDVTEELTCTKKRIRFTEQLTDEQVENVDTFSSPVCLLRDCYAVSPLYGKMILPAASTERWVDEQLTDELVQYLD